jgi:hypothetical protein
VGADTEEKGCLEKGCIANVIYVGIEDLASLGKKNNENMFDAFCVGDGLKRLFDRRLTENI